MQDCCFPLNASPWACHSTLHRSGFSPVWPLAGSRLNVLAGSHIEHMFAHQAGFVEGQPSEPDILAAVTEPAESDSRLAERLATEAGRLLVELRQSMWADGAHSSDVMDHGDLSSHQYIAHQLRLHRPGDAVLDEEAAEDRRRFTNDRVWIIDPLDGTREFGEPGRHDWAVHVALWIAIISLQGLSPSRRSGWCSPPIQPLCSTVERSRPRLVTSRSRAPYAAVIVANALDCDAIRLGSAGAKAMAVVLGDADIYLHDGGMYQWDSAAPAAVALAAGLHASRIDGTPLVYNDRDPWLPDLLICRPELASSVLEALWT